MTYTVASSCVCTSPLAVMTIVGLHDFVKVSISASFKSFLLIDAPESTTNCRSSGLRVDAGRHLFSEGEKNVALSCSFNYNTFLASFHAASRAPCSCHSVSSRDRSSNSTLMRFTWANQSERRIFVSNFSVTCNSFRDFHTLDWSLHVCALPENRLRRLHVLKYTTQLSCIRWTASNRSVIWLMTGVMVDNGLSRSMMQLILLQHDYCTFCHHSFLDLLLGCSSTWRCA